MIKYIEYEIKVLDKIMFIKLPSCKDR